MKACNKHTTVGIRLPKVSLAGGFRRLGRTKEKTRRNADRDRKTRTLFEPCQSVESA
ncbi:MAG: hypothetical protein LBD45_01330 [Bacteroidales bacterium]|jgi:hypothetical protein|nr:hypothetical protein [Bacteroidales bacterium]